MYQYKILNRSFNPFASYFGTDYSSNNIKDELRDTDDAVILDLELPGFKKDDIKIRVENDTLYVEAQLFAENGAEKELLKSKSSAYRLPQNIDQEAITAKYEAGILSLSLPKKQETKAKAISIVAE